MVIGFLLQAVGGWLRYAAYNNFGMAVGGQVLLALAFNFILATPAYIGHVWFPPKETTYAVVVGTFANSIGIAIGFIVPAFFVSDDQTLEQSALGIQWTLLVEAIILCAPLIPCILFFKNRPESHSKRQEKDSENNDDEETKNYWSWVWKCVKNWKLFISSAAFGMGYGLAITILAVMVSLLPPSFSTIKVSITGLIFVLSGVFFGILGAIFLALGKAKGHYDVIVKFFFCASMIALICVAVFMKPGTSDAVIYILHVVGGFGLIAFTPFGVQSLIESGYPAPENIPTTWMYWWGLVWAIFGTYVTGAVSTSFRLWVLVIMLAPATLWVMFMHHTKYKKTGRRPGEKEKKAENGNKEEGEEVGTNRETNVSQERSDRPKVQIEIPSYNLVALN